MFNSLFANIFFPLFASLLIAVIRWDDARPILAQIASFGTDLCVLAMGATAGILANPELAAKWGGQTLLQVGLFVFAISAILAAVSVRVIPVIWRDDLRRQAEINFRLGLFALSLVSVVNLVAEW